MLLPVGLLTILYGCFGQREKARKVRMLTKPSRRQKRAQDERLEAQAHAILRQLAAMQKLDPSSVPVDLLHVDRDMLICYGAYYLPSKAPRVSLEALEPGNPA